MSGRSGLSPVVAASGWGRGLAFFVGFLLVIGGLGSIWLQQRSPKHVAAVTLANAPKDGSLIANSGSPVFDEAVVLSETARRQLSAKLVLLKAELGPEMAVLTVNSLDGQTIEAYSLARANQMQLGDNVRNDGVLLLIAPNQKQVRIEVGKGLTTVLSNSAAKRIIDAMIPLFRTGQIDAATNAGVDGVIEHLRQLQQLLPRKAA